MSTAYCVKCKEKREVQDPEQVTMKNGRKALKGTCPNCGTKMFKIGGQAFDLEFIYEKDGSHMGRFSVVGVVSKNRVG